MLIKEYKLKEEKQENLAYKLQELKEKYEDSKYLIEDLRKKRLILIR